MKTFRLLVLLALSGLYACNKSDNENQPPLFPLNDGNSWTYEVTTYNGGKPSTQTAKMEVKAYTIDGHKGFALQQYTKGAPISLLNNDDKGNCIETLFNNDKFVHQTIAFKKDVKKGDKWMYKAAVYTNDDYSQYEIEDREMTCSTADTVIITPKGSFHCIGFMYHPGGTDDKGRPHHTMYNFLSENIGMVKLLHYEHENGKTWFFSENTLTDYSLK